MKKLIALLFILFTINLKAQITLEFVLDSASTYPVAGGNAQLMIINFEVSGDKYVNVNRWGKYISIYGMNHALQKTISLAGLPPNSTSPSVGDVMYLSEHLFNTDSLIEFMYIKDGSSVTSYRDSLLMSNTDMF